MKCILLAGGTGDRLWPISRKNFPKQFIEINKGRSMFQEAVLRNMAFCDSFIIVTNTSYANIVKSQLRVFQGLKYSLVLERVPIKTAPSITRICLDLEPDDEILITYCDFIIDGDYNSEILKAKAKLNENRISSLVVKPTNDDDDFRFIKYKDGKYEFDYKYEEGSYWECGVILSKVSSFLSSINKEYLEKCKKISIEHNFLIIENESEVAKRLNEVMNPELLSLIKCKFQWNRIVDLSTFYEYATKSEDFTNNVISHRSKNVEVINSAKEEIIVLNDLKNLVVANTKDAIFISSINNEKDIKVIGKEYENEVKNFTSSRYLYYPWGISERIDKTKHTKINKLTIYPGSTAQITYRLGYYYNYIVSSGEIEFENNHKTCTYKKNEHFFVNSKSKYHLLRNNTAKEVRVTQIIDWLSDDDETIDNGFMFRLKPIFQDFIWGGTKIRDVLNKDTYSYDTVAESWELSAHKNGQSIIDSGIYKGMNFGKFVKTVGLPSLGWKVQTYNQFPLMIKFIDAKRDLSIQVHPQDEYSFANEKDYGKNEMWYVMDAEEDACIYVGFNRDVTKEEIIERINNKTLVDVLNKIKVKPGDSFYIEAGTVHAIGAGCLICEVQQSSDVTYRLYDYGRLDKNGKPRTLHIKQALDVLDLKKKDVNLISPHESEANEAYKKSLMAVCKYFTVNKYEIKSKLTIPANDSTFRVVVAVDGEGTISNGIAEHPIYKGDTYFCGCKEIIELTGNITVLISNV